MNENEDNKDQYRLGMFPLMLQALYNITTASEHYDEVPDHEWDLCVEDCLFILRMFSSIGIARREGKTTARDGTIGFPHFSYESREAIQKRFNPAVLDESAKVKRLKEEIKQIKSEHQATLDRMSHTIQTLRDQLKWCEAPRKTDEAKAELAANAKEIKGLKKQLKNAVTEWLRYKNEAESLRKELGK